MGRAIAIGRQDFEDIIKEDCFYIDKKVIILLDEYDTPMQEAYVNGYWKELSAFTRSLFNSTFKTNEYLERAVMTGITRVSRESIFSDLKFEDLISGKTLYTQIDEQIVYDQLDEQEDAV